MKTYNVPKLPPCTPLWISDAFTKAQAVFSQHERPFVSVSGGADSDIMMDLIWRLVGDKATYVFFDTGMEWEASKAHLTYLENRYGVEIRRVKAKTPVAACVRKYGQPFMTKVVSHCIERLQCVGFPFDDRPLEELLKEYPRQTSYLKWWTNEYKRGEHYTAWNVSKLRGLREYMLAHPLTFRVSNKCCYYAKKKTAQELEKNGEFDLCCTGIRRAEGGVRSTTYNNCFSSKVYGVIDTYRPLFWFDAESIKAYCETFGIVHSDCYTLWGLKRTGCAGCPFASDVFKELEAARPYEPGMVAAAEHLFADSYEAKRGVLAMRGQL